MTKPAIIRLPLGEELTRLDTGSAARRVKSPPLDIPISVPLLPRWDELAGWMRQIDRTRVYTNRGPLGNELERQLEFHYTGDARAQDRVCLAASGTLGLVASLLTLELPPGSLCALPSWTFIATADAVVAAGLKPYLVDCALDTWALDPVHVERAIASMPSRPRVVIVVSPFGAPVDTRAWEEFVRATGIAVIVDAAAAFDAAVLSSLPTVVSLHATKSLGVGEGGFVMSSDTGFIQRLKQVTNYGFSVGRVAHRIGLNAKMSEYHAAIGLAQLQKWHTTRRSWMRIARRYRDAFGGRDDVVMLPGYGEGWVTSTAVFRFVDRSANVIANELRRYNVDSRRWWHRGLTHHPAFAELPAEALDNAERLADEVLALPCFLTLRDAAMKAVIHAVRSVLDA